MRFKKAWLSACIDGLFGVLVGVLLAAAFVVLVADQSQARIFVYQGF